MTHLLEDGPSYRSVCGLGSKSGAKIVNEKFAGRVDCPTCKADFARRRREELAKPETQQALQALKEAARKFRAGREAR